MDQGVVASIPLGVIVLAALVLLAAGAAAGWVAARARARRRSRRAARESLAQMAELLNALPQAALVADADARIVARNPRAAQLLKELERSGDLPLTVDAAVGRAIRSRVPEALEIASPGPPAWRLQVSVAPLRASEMASEALVLFTDPSAGSNRAEVYQRLISTIAHELRTPLTAIMGHVDILDSCRLDEEALWRRSLGFVACEAERLARLVEDLLSLSRLDRIPLHLQPVNVRAAAEEAISELFETAERNNVMPVLQAPAELPRVLADPDRIRQVFLNLLDNAIKYAPGSTVTVRLMPEGEMVRVEVGDIGPGIAPEDLPHIFEPFRRGERPPASPGSAPASQSTPLGQGAPGAGGTGLGLTIVRAILDQHHAPISVRSEIGRGATFAFSLSIVRSE